MAQWSVVAGPASRDLAEGVARRLKADWLEVECHLFPDGESKVRIPSEATGRNVILVQSTYPPVDRHLLQLFFIADKLGSMGAGVHAVLPYLGYARQDREFLSGEAVSIRVVARLLAACGVRRVVAIDVHSQEALSYFSVPAQNLSAIPLLASYVTENHRLERPLVIAPDLKASTLAESFAHHVNGEALSFRKTRDRVTGEVKVEEANIPAAGREVLIVDDIISTGASVEKAALMARSAGARRITAACVHPILVEGALERLRKAGVDQVVGTNTVPSPVSVVDVAPLIASHFERFSRSGST